MGTGSLYSETEGEIYEFILGKEINGYSLDVLVTTLLKIY